MSQETSESSEVKEVALFISAISEFRSLRSDAEVAVPAYGISHNDISWSDPGCTLIFPSVTIQLLQSHDFKYSMKFPVRRCVPAKFGCKPQRSR